MSPHTSVVCDGDCLYEWTGNAWVVVYGCGLGPPNDCECEGPPPPLILDFAQLTEIIRKPCVPKSVGVSVSSSTEGIDAYGFLLPRTRGPLHCIRARKKDSWKTYFYDQNDRTEPATRPSFDFEGYLECLSPDGRVLASGMLMGASEMPRLKRLMTYLDAKAKASNDDLLKLLASQADGPGWLFAS